MIEVNPYFAPGERYPSIIGVKADGDEYELAYIRRAEAMEREEKFKGLIRDMWAFGFGPNSGANSAVEWLEYEREIRDRIDVLGIEVEE